MTEPVPAFPRYTTASVGLFSMTIVVLGLLSYAYFAWYNPQPMTIAKKVKEITVSPGDNLQLILKNISEPTCLLITPSFRKGTFRIDGKSNIVLKGFGKKEDIVIEGSSEEAGLLLQDCIGCRLENITLRTTTDKHPALKILHGSKIELHQLNLDAPDAAIVIDAQSNEILMNKCQITGRVVVSNSNKCLVTENKITCDNLSLPKPILQVSKVSQIVIDNNEFKGAAGITLNDVTSEEGTPDCILKQNKIVSNKSSVVLENCSNLLLILNSLETENGPALSLHKCTNIQIGKTDSKNTIKSIKKSAVSISGSSDILLSDTWLANQDTDIDTTSLSYALEIDSCPSVELNRNEISGLANFTDVSQTTPELKGGGIFITNSIVILKNNRVFRGLRKGIYVKKQSDVSFIGNIVQDNGDSGIEIENSQVAIGTNNHITRNMNAGIVVKNCEGTIEENIIDKNNAEGIVLENFSAKDKNKSDKNGIVYRNKIHGNGSDGISLKGSVTLIENDFIENQGYGILFRQASKKIEGRDNTFRDNKKKDTN